MFFIINSNSRELRDMYANFNLLLTHMKKIMHTHLWSIFVKEIILELGTFSQ